jgi:hypothetical protein
VLDFPTREVFAQELRENQYDIVGISSIIVNVGKVREMCRMVREIARGPPSWWADTSLRFPGSRGMIDADQIVRGDGIAWMRRFLGEDETAPIEHPEIVSGFDARTLGLKLPQAKGARPRRLFRRWGVRWAVTSAPRRRFLAARGSI